MNGPADFEGGGLRIVFLCENSPRCAPLTHDDLWNLNKFFRATVALLTEKETTQHAHNASSKLETGMSFSLDRCAYSDRNNRPGERILYLLSLHPSVNHNPSRVRGLPAATLYEEPDPARVWTR